MFVFRAVLITLNLHTFKILRKIQIQIPEYLLLTNQPKFAAKPLTDQGTEKGHLPATVESFPTGH